MLCGSYESICHIVRNPHEQQLRQDCQCPENMSVSKMLWEKRKNWVKIYVVLFLVTQSCLTLLDSSVHGDFPGKNTGLSCHALLQGIFPTKGLNLRSLSLQVESLMSEPPEKPKNAGVGNLALLLSDSGIEPGSPALQEDSLPVEPPGKSICSTTS